MLFLSARTEESIAAKEAADGDGGDSVEAAEGSSGAGRGGTVVDEGGRGAQGSLGAAAAAGAGVVRGRSAAVRGVVDGAEAGVRATSAGRRCAGRKRGRYAVSGPEADERSEEGDEEVATGSRHDGDLHGVRQSRKLKWRDQEPIS
jgi:hypothetical protein